MFGEFLSIVFKSIKLDKSLYSDNKTLVKPQFILLDL
jgi:hypothetical protein